MKRPVCKDCVHYESREEFAGRTDNFVGNIEHVPGGCNWDNVVRKIFYPETSCCGQHHKFKQFMRWTCKWKVWF